MSELFLEMARKAKDHHSAYILTSAALPSKLISFRLRTLQEFCESRFTEGVPVEIQLEKVAGIFT